MPVLAGVLAFWGVRRMRGGERTKCAEPVERPPLVECTCVSRIAALSNGAARAPIFSPDGPCLRRTRHRLSGSRSPRSR